MFLKALEVLACPDCASPLAEVTLASDPVESGRLRCTLGHEFEVRAGIPVLVPAGDRDRLQATSRSYASAWSRDGWGSADSGYLAGLPYRDSTGQRKSEWRVKSRSMEALFRVLDSGRWPRIVDLGCGTGWLSHYLSVRGHEVYAVDVSLDDRLGLGAAGTYVRSGPFFERVCGELDHPPVQTSKADAVVCNASLHYAENLEAVLHEVDRILRPGGFFAVLNSPTYLDSISAERTLSDFRRHLRDLGASEDVVASYHHFVRRDLEAAIGSAVGMVTSVPYDPGWRFRGSRWARSQALRMELASFPILVATKPNVGRVG